MMNDEYIFIIHHLFKGKSSNGRTPDFHSGNAASISALPIFIHFVLIKANSVMEKRLYAMGNTRVRLPLRPLFNWKM